MNSVVEEVEGELSRRLFARLLLTSAEDFFSWFEDLDLLIAAAASDVLSAAADDGVSFWRAGGCGYRGFIKLL